MQPPSAHRHWLAAERFWGLEPEESGLLGAEVWACPVPCCVRVIVWSVSLHRYLVEGELAQDHISQPQQSKPSYVLSLDLTGSCQSQSACRGMYWV